MIGLEETVPFEEGEGMIEVGDKVFLYSDGIIELKNEEGKQFGEERFLTILNHLQDEPLPTIISEVNL